MNTETGELIPEEKYEAALKAGADPLVYQQFKYGQVVQIEEGFFEICKIDLRKQRLTLKPIPAPDSPQAPRHLGDGRDERAEQGITAHQEMQERTTSIRQRLAEKQSSE